MPQHLPRLPHLRPGDAPGGWGVIFYRWNLDISKEEGLLPHSVKTIPICSGLRGTHCPPEERAPQALHEFRYASPDTGATGADEPEDRLTLLNRRPTDWGDERGRGLGPGRGMERDTTREEEHHPGGGPRPRAQAPRPSGRGGPSEPWTPIPEEKPCPNTHMKT